MPPQEPPVHVVPEDPVDEEAQEPEDQHVDEDVCHRVVVVVLPERVTEAYVAHPEHLGGHKAHPPDAH